MEIQNRGEMHRGSSLERIRYSLPTQAILPDEFFGPRSSPVFRRDPEVSSCICRRNLSRFVMTFGRRAGSYTIVLFFFFECDQGHRSPRGMMPSFVSVLLKEIYLLYVIERLVRQITLPGTDQDHDPLFRVINPVHLDDMAGAADQTARSRPAGFAHATAH
jgi:hypothetical protein